MLTNMYTAQAESNFCEAQKHVTIEEYSLYMGYVHGGTEWLTAVQSVEKHEVDRTNHLFASWT